jgi:hypothetical protein
MYKANEAQNTIAESNGAQDSNLSDSSREFSQHIRCLKRNCGTNAYKESSISHFE